MIRITDTLFLDDHLVEERFVRASGPGGQNVNKVASAVELRANIAASSLPPEVQARLADLAGRRMTADGVLIIDSREHRTQARNRDAAYDRLIALVRQAARRRRTRTATRPTAAARERRLDEKKRTGAAKRARRQTGDDG